MMYDSPYWSWRLTLKFWATFSMKVRPRRGKASCWQQLGLATPKSHTSCPGNCPARCQRAFGLELVPITPSQWARNMMNELFLSKSSNTSNWAKNSTMRKPTLLTQIGDLWRSFGSSINRRDWCTCRGLLHTFWHLELFHTFSTFTC